MPAVIQGPSHPRFTGRLKSVIAQATVPVLEDDDRDRLAARILVEEHALLVRVLGWVSEGRVRVVESDQKRGRVVVDAPER